jgi:hypothetical protein
VSSFVGAGEFILASDLFSRFSLSPFLLYRVGRPEFEPGSKNFPMWVQTKIDRANRCKSPHFLDG